MEEMTDECDRRAIARTVGMGQTCPIMFVRRHHKLIGWLAACLFMARLIAGVVCPMPAASDGTGLTDALLGPMAICTSDGLRVLPSGDSPDQPAPAPDHCPACTLAKVFGLAILLAAAGLLLLDPGRDRWTRPAATRSRAGCRTSRIRIGGPPLPA